MLLWDHSVRRLMHTSPPWDVPQASPSAINQAFRSRDATLNPKLRLELFQVRSLSPYRSQFAHFSFLLTLIPLLCTYNPHTRLELNSIRRKCFNLSFDRPVITPGALKSPPTPSTRLKFITNPAKIVSNRNECRSIRIYSSQFNPMCLNSSPNVNNYPEIVLSY